jgi:hypothetical protein
MRTIAGLRSPDPAAAARVIGLVRIVGERLTAAGVLPSPLLIWRLTAEELDRAIAGTPPALRSGPGRWEPFVVEVVRARGRGTRAAVVAPGVGAGTLHPLSDLRALFDLRSIGHPGPRSVLAAALPLPHLAPLLWHSAALVTTGGTSGAHLFEVARSLGLPAVIAPDLDVSAEAGSLVAVDGDTGRVSVLSVPESTGSGATPVGGPAPLAMV